MTNEQLISELVEQILLDAANTPISTHELASTIAQQVLAKAAARKPDEMCVEVKPLEWESPCAANNCCHIARTGQGDYYVGICGGRHDARLESYVKPYEVIIGETVGSVAEAQTLCGDHYRETQLSSLTTCTVAEVRKEAFEEVAAWHEEIARHDESGIEYSSLVGIQISNAKELDMSANTHRWCAAQILARSKDTPV